MNVFTMKSETAETDRTKIESRQSIHRRKMSKNSSVVNGADESVSYVAEDESVVRQINLAAAFHDHISCTKSAELCKIDGSRESSRVMSLPCETDHIYANCSGEIKNNKSPSVNNTPVTTTTPKLTVESKKMRNLIIIQMELIRRLERELVMKNKLIKNRKLESDPSLNTHLDRKDRMSLLRNHHKSEDESTDINISQVEPEINNTIPTVSSTTTENSVFAVPVASPVVNEHSSTIPSVNLVTRYFGRSSKTIPSRALKRRYLGPPKTIPFKKPTPISSSSATSASSESEIQEDERVPKAEIPKESKQTSAKYSLTGVKKVGKRRGKRSKVISKKMDFLMTDKAYFLLGNQASQPSLVNSIDVPSWILRPVTSFYQMEGTENINDPVFQRRHLKCEQDERRRKRWDIQRMREQKANEKLKLKLKAKREAEKERVNIVKSKTKSFCPDPYHFQFIEITDKVPVLAFSCLIPLFQPSDFSIPWNCGNTLPLAPTETSPNKMAKKGRLSVTDPKVT